MDPPEAPPYAAEHRLLGKLGADPIAEIAALVGPGSGSPMVSFELRHLGGALARRPRGHGALAGLDGQFAMFCAARVPDHDSEESTQAHFERLCDALSPFEVGFYPNFAEHRVAAQSLFAPDVQGRLENVRDRFDPDGVFLARQPVSPEPRRRNPVRSNLAHG